MSTTTTPPTSVKAKPGKAFTAMNPKAMECVCDHPYQDKVYGSSRRLHNPTKDKWRCTVCGRTTNRL